MEGEKVEKKKVQREETENKEIRQRRESRTKQGSYDL